jgi:hypothetical protein
MTHIESWCFSDGGRLGGGRREVYMCVCVCEFGGREGGREGREGREGLQRNAAACTAARSQAFELKPSRTNMQQHRNNITTNKQQYQT